MNVKFANMTQFTLLKCCFYKKKKNCCKFWSEGLWADGHDSLYIEMKFNYVAVTWNETDADHESKTAESE